MSNNSIPQPAGNGNPLDPDYDTYREIVTLIPEMQVSVTSNPRRFVTAQGWRFVLDYEGPFGSLVFGESPAGDIYLVDGVAAMRVMELLEARR